MKTKVCHIITRLILGGAQENTVATVALLNGSADFEADLITGPAIGPEGTLLPYAQTRIKNIFVVNELRRSINPVFDFIALIKLYGIIKKGKYDIVHTHSSKAGILGRIAAKLAGTKMIAHTIHGLPYHPYQSKFVNCFYAFLERFVSRFTDKIITVADVMADKAVEAGVADRGKFTTVYSGMDLDTFLKCPGDQKLRAALGISSADLVIGKIARLYHLKGHSYIIESAKDICKQFPGVKFLFVGDGILKEEFVSMIKGGGLEGKFIFAGLVRAQDVSRYISIMDIVVHASLREGLPRVVAQALACGKPVVAFDIDGAREVVHDGKTGLLVSPENVAQLKDALIKLIKDRDLRIRMGAEGRKLVDPVFRNEYMVEKIKEVYHTRIDVKVIK